MKFREQMRMQQRELDRILNRFDGRFLPPDFRPRQFWHAIEVMFLRTRRRHHLQGHAIIGINPDFVALLHRRFRELGGPLQDHRLGPVFVADPQAIRPDHLSDLGDRTGWLKAKVTDNDESLVHQDPGSLL